MLSARFAIWNGGDHISAPLYTSPNSILHIKRSSVPSRGPDISTMSRIDSAGTSLMNSMPWHMPMIGRRLVPRISIPVRILHPSVFSCMITYTYVCAGMSALRRWCERPCQTFWFYMIRAREFSVYSLCALFLRMIFIQSAEWKSRITSMQNDIYNVL